MADIGREEKRIIFIPVPDYTPEPIETPAPAPVEPEKVPA